MWYVWEATRRWETRSCLAIASLVIGLLAGSGRAAPADETAGAVDYNREIRPILARSCFACHGPDEESRQGGLRLDRREDALRGGDGGVEAIVPGDPDLSELVFRITEEDATVRMPPEEAGERLTEDEVALLTRWIDQGAPYAEHWAYVPPEDRPLPEVARADWPRNGIDRWILARLEREGLGPSPEADPHTLIRRVSLDLRGLPPTPEEVAAFLADTEPGAYERAVDRFLDDPAYGERWARVWLDLARYADSSGYGSDPLRPEMWRYRDWVIDAFNRNLPFDRFTTEQLAGDLLPDATLDQKIATAFHRNTMTNTEGGTDDEEFRVAAIKDRVNTTFQVWMGLTMGCAQCHSHKYDPITQTEYYQVFAIFNQTADNDQPSEAPTMPAPTPAQQAAIDRIDARLATLRPILDQATPELAAGQAAWEETVRQPVTWVTLDPIEARSDGGATLESRPDGSIRVSGTAPAQDVYTLTAEFDHGPITAFRLEAIPDPDFPGGGSGRAEDGNFVLSRFAVEAERAIEGHAKPRGRYVRVEVPGKDRMLSLAEVEVFHGETNVALQGKAGQVSTDYEGHAEKAIDGNTDGRYVEAASTTHTRTGETDPWWEVALPETTEIDRIVIWNRTDSGTESRLANARVSVLDEDRNVVWRADIAEPPTPSRELRPDGRRSIALARAAADFSQKDFEVSKALAAKADPRTGWAVGPQVAGPHEAVFVAATPIDHDGPVRLTIRLEHAYRDAGYTLGSFRLSATSDAASTRRLDVPREVLALIETPADERTPEQSETVAAHYRSIAPELKPIRDEIASLEASRPKPPALPVMVELPPEQRRKTYFLNKGNFLDPGPEVEPGLPTAFLDAPDDGPIDRLAVASWLMDPSNPLTARVAVNRYWSQIFGAGLVETEEDFGTQGDPPSHPELLDWLALEYQRLGWDTKAFLKRLVTSATYRQSSAVSPDLLARDPRNRLWARAPRYRLEAEMVRDQALALSGLLNREVGGPSVFPPQPDGLWQAAFNGQRTWATSPGPERYRRGLYTFWRRTVPYPSMATFDAPSRELCTLRRARTNTPLQAFVTLNDPVYVEAAQALGRRLMNDGGGTTEARIRFGLELCLARPADAGQVAVLADLHQDLLEHYRERPDEARTLATEPIGPLPEGVDPVEAAVWTALANVLLNLDGVLTRG